MSSERMPISSFVKFRYETLWDTLGHFGKKYFAFTLLSERFHADQSPVVRER